MNLAGKGCREWMVVHISGWRIGYVSQPDSGLSIHVHVHVPGEARFCLYQCRANCFSRDRLAVSLQARCFLLLRISALGVPSVKTPTSASYPAFRNCTYLPVRAERGYWMDTLVIAPQDGHCCRRAVRPRAEIFRADTPQPLSASQSRILATVV
jgi:hypothetical protein